jgi:hypothetical protein
VGGAPTHAGNAPALFLIESGKSTTGYIIARFVLILRHQLLLAVN